MDVKNTKDLEDLLIQLEMYDVVSYHADGESLSITREILTEEVEEDEGEREPIPVKLLKVNKK
jgi:hypothetical protein